ncbi:hypothetical protein Lal_00033004 [Lupinus albus]|nr:hypothetical protein Lal_00033004 [Lupinus albus]
MVAMAEATNGINSGGDHQNQWRRRTLKSLVLNGDNKNEKKAIREWREYEDAVKRKDLSRALTFLKSLETEQQPLEPFGEGSLSSLAESTRSRFLELERFGPQKDWEILDTCLNADDMKLVGNAYKFLRDRGFLPNFGKCRNMVLEGPRNVTPDVLTASTGLEVTKLAPKKWGLSESSSTVLVAFLGTVSFLISQGIDLRPNLAVILGLATIDSIFLGGTCLAQISSYWPPYRRRILIHEAGHLLTAYLMGCPIRGVVLDPIVAMQMGIQGQKSLMAKRPIVFQLLATTILSPLRPTMAMRKLRENLADAIVIAIAMPLWRLPKPQYCSRNCGCGVQFKILLVAIAFFDFSAVDKGQVIIWTWLMAQRHQKDVFMLRQTVFHGQAVISSLIRTQFWDEKVANDLAEGRLDGTAFDRYCMVLFSGIAAEALVYGEAEGGENDENLFRSICLLLEPPLSVAQMSNQARWSVLQSYNLLKWHRSAHRAAVKALESGGSLSVVIRSIEETLYSKRKGYVNGSEMESISLCTIAYFADAHLLHLAYYGRQQ